MIIIEGPDRCGKTSLAKCLSRDMGCWAYRHHGVPEGITPYNYYSWIATSRSDVIVDRLHWSEYAYGMTYRGKSGLSQHEMRLIDIMLGSLGTVIVLLSDSKENVIKRWKDEPFSSDGFDLLDKRFQEMMVDSPHLTYFVTLRDLFTDPENCEGPTPMYLNIIKSAFQYQNDMYTLLSPNVAAGFTNGFLVMGEGPGWGKHKEHWIGPPFCYGPAADWFWKAMDQAGINWQKGYYTNASAFRSHGDLAQTMFAVRPKAVLALGVAARKLLEPMTSLPNVTYLNHPQFERRFNHGEIDDYSERFKEALKGFTYET